MLKDGEQYKYINSFHTCAEMVQVIEITEGMFVSSYLTVNSMTTDGENTQHVLR